VQKTCGQSSPIHPKKTSRAVVERVEIQNADARLIPIFIGMTMLRSSGANSQFESVTHVAVRTPWVPHASAWGLKAA
jgi:hypothetical protein